MAEVYYKIDGDNIYYTNENKTGYTLRTASSDVTTNKTVIIELYNDKFVFPVDSSKLFWKANNETFNDMDKWDTSECTNMYTLFYVCDKLTSLYLIKFNTSNVTVMDGMFYGCERLTSLDVSSFDTSSVTSAISMFYGCSRVHRIYASDNFIMTSIPSTYMFLNCNSLEGDHGTTYSSSNITYTYARIDNPPDAPGYFSKTWAEYNMYIKDNGRWVEAEVYL